MTKGEIAPPIEAKYPLKDVVKAVQHAERIGKRCKVLFNLPLNIQRTISWIVNKKWVANDAIATQPNNRLLRPCSAALRKAATLIFSQGKTVIIRLMEKSYHKKIPYNHQYQMIRKSLPVIKSWPARV